MSGRRQGRPGRDARPGDEPQGAAGVPAVPADVPAAPADAPVEVPTAAPAEVPADAPVGEPRSAPPRSVLRSLLRTRPRRVDLAVAALLGVLGFAMAVQVRSTQEDGLLASARQEDLVRILDDLSSRSDRLRQEIASLTEARTALTTGTDRDAAALAEARRRAQVLGVLAGTVPAEGPGIVLTISDPGGEVESDALLDAVQEMRDAGLEAVQVEGRPEGGRTPVVRVVASTWFADGDGGVVVDDVLLRPPYRFVVVGEPRTLASALGIPGGVEDTVEQQGGQTRVEERPRVRVAALRPLARPRYARPAPGATPANG